MLLEFEPRNSILNFIIKCANCAMQDKDLFRNAMHELAKELRAVFESEYCSIGIVAEGYAEDIIIDYEQFEDRQLFERQETILKTVKRASVNVIDNFVVHALKSDNSVSWYSHESLDKFSNYKSYQHILTSSYVKNSCVIPIRDINNVNFGFIQFINTNKKIDYEHDILPFKDAFLGLVQIIINNQKYQQELIRRANRLKDADFYSLMLDKIDDINLLLDSIMGYLSDVFNAAIISFRIPLLNGYNYEPLLYLRRFFVHNSVGDFNREEIINYYNKKRSVKKNIEMDFANVFWCVNHGRILERKSSFDLKCGLELDDKTLIMPIFSDFETQNKCINSSRKMDGLCSESESRKCKEQFRRLYGIFRLRISKTDLHTNAIYQIDYESIKQRLTYLSKQITLLLNSIIDRRTNESLHIFQYELKNSSFIKIKDFDQLCVDIIKHSFCSTVCSIYRYDDRTKYLSLSATTAKIVHFKVNDNNLYFESKQIKESCFIHVDTQKNLLTRAYKTKNCMYVIDLKDSRVHQSPFMEHINSSQESAIAIPMIKKDGSCAGVVLLLGKDANNHSISTTYWEFDIKRIELIVDILTRISESDTERLTFLSQLAHELLGPVTEMVYDNDLTVNIAERNPDTFNKRQLISKLRDNIDRNMLFKYIISDTEFIYSTSGRRIEYNIVKHEKPQRILLDAIRLMENSAHAKGVSITTHISKMPPLYFDKERMMQVFINLLENAIKYSDSHTTINVSYDRGKDDFHEICFANVGIGVQEEEKEIIFELFQRGDAAKKKFSRGTGIGLYIIRDIMRMHGGDCYVQKTENPTVFVISLPNKS